MNKKISFLISTKTNVVGTQKNCLHESKNLCNFGRGHNNEHLCENIFQPVVQEMFKEKVCTIDSGLEPLCQSS